MMNLLGLEIMVPLLKAAGNLHAGIASVESVFVAVQTDNLLPRVIIRCEFSTKRP